MLICNIIRKLTITIFYFLDNLTCQYYQDKDKNNYEIFPKNNTSYPYY